MGFCASWLRRGPGAESRGVSLSIRPAESAPFFAEGGRVPIPLHSTNPKRRPMLFGNRLGVGALVGRCFAGSQGTFGGVLSVAVGVGVH